MATPKRIRPNVRNAAGDGHAGQTAAIFKRIATNARNTIGDGEPARRSAWILNKCCLGFVIEHMIQTAIDGITCVNVYAGQTAAILKRIGTNVRNAAGDGHAGQTGATIKRLLVNACNRIDSAIISNRRWNTQRSGRTTRSTRIDLCSTCLDQIFNRSNCIICLAKCG